MPGRHKGTTSGALAEMDDVHINQWLYAQRIRRATIMQIVEMAKAPALRDEHGKFDLGYGLGMQLSRSTVDRRIKLINAEYVAENAQTADELRALELNALDAQAARIDDLVQRLQPQLDPLTGEYALRPAAYEKRLTAENTLLRVSESRRKLLGIDAPVQVHVEAHVVHEDAVAIELARMLDEEDAGARKKSRKKGKKHHKNRA